MWNEINYRHVVSVCSQADCSLSEHKWIVIESGAAIRDGHHPANRLTWPVNRLTWPDYRHVVSVCSKAVSCDHLLTCGA